MKRKDIQKITINDCNNIHHCGILLDDNENWFYFWKLNGFTIDGTILIRKSCVNSHDIEKISKFEFKVLKDLYQLDIIKNAPENKIELPENDNDVIRAVTNMYKDPHFILYRKRSDMPNSVARLKAIKNNKMKVRWYDKKRGHISEISDKILIGDYYMFHIECSYTDVFRAFVGNP